MQSGITASQELAAAFNRLVSDDAQRALLAGIEKETLVPVTAVPLHAADFHDDLAQLSPHISPNAALYILLKVDPRAADGYVAITYVPDAAPVRQKMLFASTRLTLVRELGIERFRQTLFATDASDLTAAGWSRHEQHEALPAPLTAEEAGLAGVKAAEAHASHGTAARRGHVPSRVSVAAGAGVVEALAALNHDACAGTLVQLEFRPPHDTLHLHSRRDHVPPADVPAALSPTHPRYAFYRHPRPPPPAPRILFLYTCPAASHIRDRMVYSTAKAWARTLAETEAGVAVTTSLEATEPSELAADVVSGGIAAGGGGGGVGGGDGEPGVGTAAPKAGFARPKRPGRR